MSSILYVVHGLPPDEASGSPLAAHGYASALSEAGWDVTVLSMRHDAPPWSSLRVERHEGERFARVPVRPTSAAGTVWSLGAASRPTVPMLERSRAARDEDPAAAFRRLLVRLSPDVVHVVDNVDLPLFLPEIARHVGIPVVRTVSCAEDLCALVAPVSSCSGPMGYCEAPLTVERCARCVRASGLDALASYSAVGGVDVDRERHARLLGLLSAKRARAAAQFACVYERVVFASPGFRDYFEKTLPLDPAKVRVVPMGVDVAVRRGAEDGAGGARAGAGGGTQGPLRFVLLGAADAVKGIDAVVDAFGHPDLVGRDDWRLALAGGGDRSLFGALCSDPRVTDHGPYGPGELGALLCAAQVGLSTSIFETFHRVTREYLLAGLAVVGSNAFGISDAVVDGHNGLVFSHSDAGSLRRALVALVDDRALVARLAQGAAVTPVRSVAEEVGELESLYRAVVAERMREVPVVG